MKTIWKFYITNMDGTTIHVPYFDDLKFYDQVVHCDVQDGTPCLWARVDTGTPRRAIRVIVVGTGHDIDNLAELRHVGSFILMNGQFVGHVFAEGGRSQ